MIKVKVKEDSQYNTITALGGVQFSKASITNVSEDLAEAVLATPSLEIVGEVEASDEPLELEDMTVPVLKALAKDLEIEGYGKMKKADLIDAIYDAADAGMEDDVPGDDEESEDDDGVSEEDAPEASEEEKVDDEEE